MNLPLITTPDSDSMDGQRRHYVSSAVVVVIPWRARENWTPCFPAASGHCRCVQLVEVLQQRYASPGSIGYSQSVCPFGPTGPSLPPCPSRPFRPPVPSVQPGRSPARFHIKQHCLYVPQEHLMLSCYSKLCFVDCSLPVRHGAATCELTINVDRQRSNLRRHVRRCHKQAGTSLLYSILQHSVQHSIQQPRMQCSVLRNTASSSTGRNTALCSTACSTAFSSTACNALQPSMQHSNLQHSMQLGILQHSMQHSTLQPSMQFSILKPSV